MCIHSYVHYVNCMWLACACIRTHVCGRVCVQSWETYFMKVIYYILPRVHNIRDYELLILVVTFMK